jgi:hypothetical protein
MVYNNDHLDNISVVCVIGPNVNPLQNRETQHVKIVLPCMY